MNRVIWYRLNGHTPEPCGLLEAEKLLEDGQTRRVAFDTVGEVKISTVFLAINHNLYAGPPLLFETMVFGGPMDEERRRYSTWEQAEAGHAAVLAEVRKAAVA